MSDSDSVDESKIPSRDECERRCQQFAEITGTDSAMAMFFLQDREWDLDRAVNAYFEDTFGQQESPKKKVKVESVTLGANNSTGRTITSSSSVSVKMDRSPVTEDPEPNRIRLMSYNIDGLMEKAIEKRTQTVCEIINKENPHVVFLQEVVPETLEILITRCPTYHVIEAANEEYFTAVMLKVGVVEISGSKVIPFTTSVMLRALQKIQCTIKGNKFLLMTSHLESTKDHGEERKNQLKRCLYHMVNANNEETVIFGGDLNLRDKELKDVKGLPVGVFDLWEVTGSRKEAEFTWDMQRNTNLEWAGRFKPKCRFDRLYIRHSKPKSVIVPKYFELIGLEKIQSCGMFPSDHWGLLTHFDKREEND